MPRLRGNAGIVVLWMDSGLELAIQLFQRAAKAEKRRAERFSRSSVAYSAKSLLGQAELAGQREGSAVLTRRRDLIALPFQQHSQ